MRRRVWTRPNTDKPHRCPECHAVADTARGEYGPRTRMTCPYGCPVQWRTGHRSSRSGRVWWWRNVELPNAVVPHVETAWPYKRVR